MINNVFSNKRITTSLLLCWTIIFFAVETGYAYYRVADETEHLFFHREKASAPWGKGEKYFALYDNFNFFPQNTIMSQLYAMVLIILCLPIRLPLAFP